MGRVLGRTSAQTDSMPSVVKSWRGLNAGSLQIYMHTTPPFWLWSWRRTEYPSSPQLSHPVVLLTPITAAFVFEVRTISSSSLGSKLLALRWIKYKPYLTKQLNSSHSTWLMASIRRTSFILDVWWRGNHRNVTEVVVGLVVCKRASFAHNSKIIFAVA